VYTVALQDDALGGGGAGFVGEVFTSVGEIGKSVSNNVAVIRNQDAQRQILRTQIERAKLFHIPQQTGDALAAALAMAGGLSPEVQVRVGMMPAAAKKGLPGWAWAAIIGGGVLVLGGGALALTR